MAKCRSCGAEIEWVETKSGAQMPVNPGLVLWKEAVPGTTIVSDDGYVYVKKEDDPRYVESGRVSHFSTCPQAKSWRKRK